MVYNCYFYYYVQNYQAPFTKLFKYMLDIATGMHYISEKGLVHRVRIQIFILLRIH